MSAQIGPVITNYVQYFVIVLIRFEIFCSSLHFVRKPLQWSTSEILLKFSDRLSKFMGIEKGIEAARSAVLSVLQGYPCLCLPIFQSCIYSVWNISRTSVWRLLSFKCARMSGVGILQRHLFILLGSFWSRLVEKKQSNQNSQSEQRKLSLGTNQNKWNCHKEPIRTNEIVTRN